MRNAFDMRNEINTTINYNQYYTVSQKKLGHFYFYCNFGKCRSILKILLLLESEGSS